MEENGRVWFHFLFNEFMIFLDDFEKWAFGMYDI